MSHGDLEPHLREAERTFASLRALDADFEAAAARVAEALGAGGKLLACGNGGSAADAEHLVGELVGRFVADRRPLPALALASSGAAVTGVANDYGYEAVFARQVAAHAAAGDVLCAFSTSGRSPNIRRALEEARSLGVVGIAFLGADADEATRRTADCILAAPSRSVARIQEAHQLLIHALCSAIEKRLGEA